MPAVSSFEAPANRSRPLTPRDALFVIPEVAGRILAVPDADGDGLGDLVVERGPERGVVRSYDLVSSKNGALIRRLHSCDADRPSSFDAGRDVDGDGVADLALGFANVESRAGRVFVISGATASILVDLRGSSPNERLGSGVAFVDDIDRDGCAEVAISATQVDPKLSVYALAGRGQNAVATMALLPAGYVSLRSGRHWTEVWRRTGTSGGQGFGGVLRAVGDVDGDGHVDLVSAHDYSIRSNEPTRVLSGATGHPIADLEGASDRIGGVGDVDRDGTPDLFVGTPYFISNSRWPCSGVRIYSGRDRHFLFQLCYPDLFGEQSTTVGVDDLDGDGYADIAIGDAGFHSLAETEVYGTPGCDVDVTRLSLEVAAKLESKAWCPFTSGCAIVYSGRTRKPIFGVWAEPGSRQSLGLSVAPMPDVSGDGHPDLIVSDSRRAFVFAGPGPSLETVFIPLVFVLVKSAQAMAVLSMSCWSPQ